MRALVACECSGRVREALRARDWDAWSCDLQPAEDRSRYHYQGDVMDILDLGWDMMIAHPDCTYLCLSGVRWLYQTPAEPKPGVLYGPERWRAMHESGRFFNKLLSAPIRFKAIENSQMHGYAIDIIGRKADCYTQPWMHGDPHMKAAHFWTENLPPLVSGKIVPKEDRKPVCHHMSPRPDRARERARTNPAIAQAIAEQWGDYVASQLCDTTQGEG